MGIKADAIKHANTVDLDCFGIQASQQVMARETLRWVADHYPLSQAGVQDLARRLGRSYATAKRYIDLVSKAGLVEVAKNTGRGRKGGKWKTNTYSFKYLHRGSSVSHGPWLMGEPQTSSPLRGKEIQKKASPSSSEGGELAFPAETPPGNPQARGEGNVVAFRKRDEGDPDGWGPTYGESDQPLRATVSKLDPAVWFSRYFEDQWKAEVLSRHPEFRGTVHWGQRGPSVSYLRSQMLDHLSPDHVEAFIDGFMETVLFGAVDFRPGQNAWQRFVGWWTTVEIEDPAIAEAARERDRKGHAAMEAAFEGKPRGFLDRYPRSM